MNLAKLVNTTAKVSGGISLGMDGFDAIALGMGMIDPDNPLTALNDKLHSSDLYNAFQIGVNAVATFTGAASATMACFIAGTINHIIKEITCQWNGLFGTTAWIL